MLIMYNEWFVKEIEETTDEESTDSYLSGISDAMIVNANSRLEAIAEVRRTSKYAGLLLRMYAIHNPEWHHVSLTMVDEIDYEYLTPKQQKYRYLNNLMKSTFGYLHRVKKDSSYFRAVNRLCRIAREEYTDGNITTQMYQYIRLQISNCEVIDSVFATEFEDSFGNKASRAYNKLR